MSLTRRLRISMATLLLAGSGVVLVGAGSATALACPKNDATIETHTIRADDVFTGAVTDRRAAGRKVVYRVAVDRVYKGDVSTSEVSVSTSRGPKACGLPRLEADRPYVFFASGADLVSNAASGTAPATDRRVAQVERLLGDGRTPTPPAPVEATFTQVAGEPTSVERVAAPGLALVIVGLLGLGLAVGLSRRRS